MSGYGVQDDFLEVDSWFRHDDNMNMQSPDDPLSAMCGLDDSGIGLDLDDIFSLGSDALGAGRHDPQHHANNREHGSAMSAVAAPSAHHQHLHSGQQGVAGQQQMRTSQPTQGLALPMSLPGHYSAQQGAGAPGTPQPQLLQGHLTQTPTTAFAAPHTGPHHDPFRLLLRSMSEPVHEHHQHHLGSLHAAAGHNHLLQFGAAASAGSAAQPFGNMWLGSDLLSGFQGIHQELSFPLASPMDLVAAAQHQSGMTGAAAAAAAARGAHPQQLEPPRHSTEAAMAEQFASSVFEDFGSNQAQGHTPGSGAADSVSGALEPASAGGHTAHSHARTSAVSVPETSSPANTSESQPGTPRTSARNFSRDLVDNVCRSLTDVLPPMPDADAGPMDVTPPSPPLVSTPIPWTFTATPTLSAASVGRLSLPGTPMSAAVSPGIYGPAFVFPPPMTPTQPRAGESVHSHGGARQQQQQQQQGGEHERGDGGHGLTAGHALSAMSGAAAAHAHPQGEPPCTCSHGPLPPGFIHPTILEAILRRKKTPGPLYLSAIPSDQSGSSGAGSPARLASKKDGNVCANCGVSDTCLWRVVDDNVTLCNACGLYYRAHRKHRPPEIYSRRRNMRSMRPMPERGPSPPNALSVPKATVNSSHSSAMIQSGTSAERPLFKSPRLEG